MTLMWPNAGTMPARSPQLNLTLESFRKLKSAFATPLPQSSSSINQKTTLFSGNGVPTTTRFVCAWRVGGNGGEEEEKANRRVRVFGSFRGKGEAAAEEEVGEYADTRSKRYGARFPHPELKSSRTRPRQGQEKAGVERSRQTKRTPSPERNPDRRHFSSSSRAAFGTNVGARNNGGRGRRGRRGELENESSIRNWETRAAFGTNAMARNDGGRGRGELGNESSSTSRRRGSLGFQGDVENDCVIEERRAAFENWAREKFREAGTTALPAIEEMRQSFAPGSRRLGPHLVSSELRPEMNHQYRQTVGKSSFIGSPIADVRKSGMTSSANGVYGSSRADRRGLSSSPTSRFGAGRSEQQLMARPSTRSESWSPRSSETSQGRTSASNVASRPGVQFPAEESGKTTRGESTSAATSGGQSIPEPLLVKRKTKFPINFYGRGGTVMLVDKPQGWTSFAVCAKLRYLLKIQKVGHAGTLDPMATGLLIVCLGKATKLADSYQALTKVYSGTLRLGELTPSLDADTEVSDVLPWEHITDDQLEQAKQEFVGDIFQTPPMYSAIKVDGERLYVKARKGEQIEIPARLVTVIDFQLERSSENRQDIHFKVTCAKGTYIRSLCADLARAVGSYAHLTALRREKIGTYSVKDAWPILEFVDQYSQIRDTPTIQAKT